MDQKADVLTDAQLRQAILAKKRSHDVETLRSAPPGNNLESNNRQFAENDTKSSSLPEGWSQSFAQMSSGSGGYFNQVYSPNYTAPAEFREFAHYGELGVSPHGSASGRYSTTSNHYMPSMHGIPIIPSYNGHQIAGQSYMHAVAPLQPFVPVDSRSSGSAGSNLIFHPSPSPPGIVHSSPIPYFYSTSGFFVAPSSSYSDSGRMHVDSIVAPSQLEPRQDTYEEPGTNAVMSSMPLIPHFPPLQFYGYPSRPTYNASFAVPPISGNSVPPISGNNVPPNSGNSVPPISGNNVPPISGNNVPPISGNNVPNSQTSTASPIESPMSSPPVEQSSVRSRRTNPRKKTSRAPPSSTLGLKKTASVSPQSTQTSPQASDATTTKRRKTMDSTTGGFRWHCDWEGAFQLD